MPRSPRLFRSFDRLLGLICLAACVPCVAQAQQQAQQPSTNPSSAASPRDFAPGIETVIASTVDPADTVTPHEMVEIRADASLEWTPKLLADRTLYQDAAAARFKRDVWALEFGFKPLRMIRMIDPSAASGQRFVWYLVYRVKNTGKALQPTASEDDGAFAGVEVASGPIRYVPHMVLQGHDTAPGGGKIYRAYLDQAMPEAVPAIRNRETPGRELYTTTSMPLKPLAEGEERWGVAVWSEIDPEIDFFSVYARGLTNAYDWTNPPGVYAAGDAPGKGREFVRKTLQLNFWRPGDRFLQHENEVRYGTAPGKASLYGVDKGVDYRWVYR